MTPPSVRRSSLAQLILVLAIGVAWPSPPVCLAQQQENWYTRSFYLLHEDHHTQGTKEVGRDALPAETERLINLSRPDVIQIHAKGNPGWTTYPTQIGFTPPLLRRDVLDVWRQIADSHDYPFSVYYNIGRDGEIMRRHPQWNRNDANGQEIDRALCYHSGVAEAYLWPMIGEIMERYHPQGWWMDGSCFTVRLCYCDTCRERFNRQTGSQPPRDRDGAQWAAYHAMQRTIYREFVQQTARQIHQLDPQCLVAVNWAYSLRMPEKPDPALAYLTGDIGNRVEGLSAEAHWYDSTGVPFDLMTQLNTMHAADVPGGAPGQTRFSPKPPVQLQQEMAVVVANGGRFWVWDSPTPESGLVAARHEYLAQHVKPWLDVRRTWCLGSDRLPDVSLLNNAAAHYAVTDASGTACFNRRNSRIEGAAQLLPQLHLNYEMVGDWRLWDQDIHSPVLVVEHPKRLLPKSVAAVEQFVRSGGRLLITGMGVSSGGPQMRALCGVADVVGPRQADRYTTTFSGGEQSFLHHLFRVAPSGAEILLTAKGPQGDEVPLLTRHRVGQGYAYYFATPLLTLHGACEIPAPLMQYVFQQVAPVEDRLLSTDAPTEVSCVLRRQGEKRIVHLINMAAGLREVFKAGTRSYVNISSLPAAEPFDVHVHLDDAPRSVMLQPQNEPLDNWQYERNVVTVRVPGFAVHQMLVIE